MNERIKKREGNCNSVGGPRSSSLGGPSGTSTVESS